MPDRERDELERELEELGSRIDYPPTPDVSRTVRRRVDAHHAGRRRGSLLRAFTPAWAAVAAVAVLVSLAVLAPAIRSTFSNSASSGAGGAGQGAGGAASSSAGSAPESAARPDETEPSRGASAGSAVASPPGAQLGFGESLPASRARARVGELYLPQTPELAGEPAAIYAGGTSGGDGAVAVFRPGSGLPPLGGTDAGLLLAEVPGDLRSAYPTVHEASRSSVEEVDLGGRRGYWLPDGRTLRPQPGEAENLPGGALLWEQGDVALLLRAGVTKEEAIRIARTVR